MAGRIASALRPTSRKRCSRSSAATAGAASPCSSGREGPSSPRDSFALRCFGMLFFTGDAPAPFPCLLDDPDHDKLLEEQIAMGWGNTDQDKIPDDWRERRSLEKTYSLILFFANLENSQILIK